MKTLLHRFSHWILLISIFQCSLHLTRKKETIYFVSCLLLKSYQERSIGYDFSIACHLSHRTCKFLYRVFFILYKNQELLINLISYVYLLYEFCTVSRVNNYQFCDNLRTDTLCKSEVKSSLRLALIVFFHACIKNFPRNYERWFSYAVYNMKANL